MEGHVAGGQYRSDPPLPEATAPLLARSLVGQRACFLSTVVASATVRGLALHTQEESADPSPPQ